MVLTPQASNLSLAFPLQANLDPDREIRLVGFVNALIGFRVRSNPGVGLTRYTYVCIYMQER